MHYSSSICTVFVFLTLLKNTGSETLRGSKKNLHHHMTKGEIEYLFGVKDHSEIPEYDVTTPHETEFNGRKMSQFRRRRRARYTDVLHYKMHVFGSKLHLRLKRNEMLMAPNLVIERHHGGGTVSTHPVPNNNFYLGKVTSHPDSLVALASDNGLSGMIRTSEDTFFVQPLPAHLAKRVRRSTDSTPHLIYKASSLNLGPFSCHQVSNPVNDRFRKSVHDRKRRAASGSKFMEAALLAPQNFVDKYGENDFAKVLLIIANMVAGMYQDPSIGEIKVYYVVKRIFHINSTTDVFKFKDGDSDATKLNKILSWSAPYMSLDDRDEQHFDVFSYITKNMVGGRAIANRMCAPRLPNGNMNSDLGLQTALYVAHETGHNAFLDHDVTPECPANQYIMSARLPSGVDAATWSNCSRRVLQDFLGGNKSSCLDDSPFYSTSTSSLPSLPHEEQHKLPGEVFDGDKQCEFQYGPGFHLSPYRKGICSALYCFRRGVELSKLAPIADGTPCGERHWCIGGKCQDNGKNRIHGGWSHWSSTYSTCTRTCGGGVQHRSRNCSNPPASNGGNPCDGLTKGLWRICNIMPCPTGSPSFRQQQCTRAWGGSIPHNYGGPCALACRVGAYLKPKGTVIDGTKCYHSNTDLCIQGQCRNVGCDNVLDSNAMVDRCSKCGGDGDSCIFIKSNYTLPYTQAGANNADTIAELPVGTFDVLFRMKSATWNTLGVQNKSGTYLVGGHLGFNQRVDAAGTTIVYENKRSNYRDSVTIAGPTNAFLKVMYIYKDGVNPGVDYNFARPVQKGEVKPMSAYQWKTDPWSSCSVTCGQGVRTRSMRCQRADDLSPASDAACGTRPANTENCITSNCPSEWHITDWTDCSRSCGSGQQTRRVICRRKISAKGYDLSSGCSNATKPHVSDKRRSCNLIACAADWDTDEGLPNIKCGDPINPELLRCYRMDQFGKRDLVPPHLCRNRAKPTRLPCPTSPTKPTSTSRPGSNSSRPESSSSGTKRRNQGTHAQFSVVLTLLVPLLQLTWTFDRT